MVDNRNTLNLKVGDVIEYYYISKWYKGKVISIDKCKYQYGTQGWANGDTYIEPRIECVVNGYTMVFSVPNSKLLRKQ